VIVTCPSCASKYRVRDEAVPSGGAELECPSCKAIFVAHPPKDAAPDVAALADKLTRQKEQADQRLHELEAQLQRAQADNGRLESRAYAAEQSVARFSEELRRLQHHASVVAGETAELLSVKTTLLELQRRERGVSADLDVANGLVSSLQTEVAALKAKASTSISPAAQQRIDALTQELAAARQQLHTASSSSSASSSASGNVSSTVRSLVAAISPMLWGLENSVAYLEQFSANDATLGGHVKQLRLLQKVLQRLVDEGAA
jgi:predicted Zn finger-like uncharacterized protein